MHFLHSDKNKARSIAGNLFDDVNKKGWAGGCNIPLFYCLRKLNDGDGQE